MIKSLFLFLNIYDYENVYKNINKNFIIKVIHYYYNYINREKEKVEDNHPLTQR